MEKLIRDGNVAVLYSPGFGAGWSTWSIPKEAVFHPSLVELVESGKNSEINMDLMVKLFGKKAEHFYLGGASDLKIEWIPEGSSFKC